MSGVSGRVSMPQRRDAREAIYEPPDRSLWPLALVRDEGGGEQRLLVALASARESAIHGRPDDERERPHGPAALLRELGRRATQRA
jgi:hypothetical protein